MQSSQTAEAAEGAGKSVIAEIAEGPRPQSRRASAPLRPLRFGFPCVLGSPRVHFSGKRCTLLLMPAFIVAAPKFNRSPTR